MPRHPAPRHRALHHLALGAHDVEGLAAFYRDTLGLAEVARHRHPDGSLRSVWLDLGGSLLMVEAARHGRPRADGVEPGWVSLVRPGLFLLAVRVEAAELDELERRLAAAGAPIEQRTAHSSYARDPEGNRIALSHYPWPGTE